MVLSSGNSRKIDLDNWKFKQHQTRSGQVLVPCLCSSGSFLCVPQLRRDDAPPGLPDSSRKSTSRFKKVGISFSVAWKWLGQPGRNVVLCNTDCWCGEKKVLCFFIFFSPSAHAQFLFWRKKKPTVFSKQNLCWKTYGMTDKQKGTFSQTLSLAFASTREFVFFQQTRNLLKEDEDSLENMLKRLIHMQVSLHLYYRKRGSASYTGA